MTMNENIHADPPDIGRDSDQNDIKNAVKNAKLPGFGAAVDRAGVSRGKVRGRVWYDAEGKRRGKFVREEGYVFLSDGEHNVGYVDKNRNVFSMDGAYLATIRGCGIWLMAVLTVLALITGITGIISACCLARSAADYVPVIFITDEEHNSWELFENLPVFQNERFGDRAIVPGMRGTYRFLFENRNPNALTYAVSFGEENEHGIRLRYRLKRDGAYVSGAERYVGIDSLSVSELTIQPDSSAFFELEWFWEDDDPVDTEAGENAAVYRRTIRLSAAVLGEGGAD